MEARISTIARSLVIGLYGVAIVGLLLPILSFLKDLGVLDAGWLNAWGRNMLPWAATLVGGMLLLRARISRWCLDLAGWLCAPAAPSYRWVIVGTCFLIFTSYTWQLHIGIAHRGVPGWVYSQLPDFIRDEPIQPLTFSPGYDAEEFVAALRPDVLPFVKRDGFASSEVLFLHFRDGTARPANNQLLLVSWPKATFGITDGKVSHSEEFLAVLKHNFGNRRSGTQMVLPEAISYPSHLNYQHIDYRGYPPAEDLIGASIWTITARVDSGAGLAEIVGATKIAEVSE